jgi:ABC-type Fe2+-enterobactin transport system substrate-binding protein
VGCQPGDDASAWDAVLGHRPADVRAEVSGRFRAHGITLDQVRVVLADMGDGLYAAATSGDEEWAESVGGPLAAALLAAEVSALAAHLNSRCSAVRALAVDGLLDDLSAITVAALLGVSRQKVYDISRGRDTSPFISHAPWRPS